LQPFILGGGQEMQRRAGTENVAGIVGFARALQLAMDEYEESRNHIQGLKSTLAEGLKEIEGVTFNCDPQEGLYTVLSVNFPKTEESEWLLMNLDKQGICVSGGSACSGGRQSHVIKLLNLGDVVTVRFSFAVSNTMEEVNKVLEVIRVLLGERFFAE
jgi:cysteine desulfurase